MYVFTYALTAMRQYMDKVWFRFGLAFPLRIWDGICTYCVLLIAQLIHFEWNALLCLAWHI